MHLEDISKRFSLIEEALRWFREYMEDTIETIHDVSISLQHGCFSNEEDICDIFSDISIIYEFLEQLSILLVDVSILCKKTIELLKQV